MGGGKFFCFVEKKNECIENGVCINLLSCPPITLKKKSLEEKISSCLHKKTLKRNMVGAGGRGVDGYFPMLAHNWRKNKPLKNVGLGRNNPPLTPTENKKIPPYNQTHPKIIFSSSFNPILPKSP